MIILLYFWLFVDFILKVFITLTGQQTIIIITFFHLTPCTDFWFSSFLRTFSVYSIYIVWWYTLWRSLCFVQCIVLLLGMKLNENKALHTLNMWERASDSWIRLWVVSGQSSFGCTTNQKVQKLGAMLSAQRAQWHYLQMCVSVWWRSIDVC